MPNTIDTSSGAYLGRPDLDIIDDYMVDDDLIDQRDQILALMKTAVQEIENAASRILIELYHEAAAHYGGHCEAPKSFSLRTCEYHDFLNDALLQLLKQGFFIDPKEATNV